MNWSFSDKPLSDSSTAYSLSYSWDDEGDESMFPARRAQPAGQDVGRTTRNEEPATYGHQFRTNTAKTKPHSTLPGGKYAFWAISHTGVA